MQRLSKKILYYFNFTLVRFSKNLQQLFPCQKYLYTLYKIKKILFVEGTCLCTEFRPLYALLRLLSQLCKFAEKTASSLLILQTSQWRVVIRFMLEFDFQSLMITCSSLEGVSQNLQLINGHFKTTSGHFFANYMNIFQKTEIQTVILRC